MLRKQTKYSVNLSFESGFELEPDSINFTPHKGARVQTKQAKYIVHELFLLQKKS